MEDGFRVYLFEYDHEGSRWSLEIPARDQADAEARLAKLPWARYVCEGVMEIPASVGWWVPLWCWLRNRGHR
jgi:hypothetical protein